MIRVFTKLKNCALHITTERVQKILAFEIHAGVLTTRYYSKLQLEAEKIKLELLRFLVDAKEHGLSVAAYGAAAKGNMNRKGFLAASF